MESDIYPCLFQIIAVLIGGMSILSGHLSAETLTKFLLYSEWLIYSTWWIGDNVSNLMQSVGASEKVFQLMDLLPSEQFTTEGRISDKYKIVKNKFHQPFWFQDNSVFPSRRLNICI